MILRKIFYLSHYKYYLMFFLVPPLPRKASESAIQPLKPVTPPSEFPFDLATVKIMSKYRFFLTRIFPYKDRIYEKVQVRENPYSCMFYEAPL